MKKNAGILKVFCTLALVFEIAIFVVVAIGEVMLLVSGSFSEMVAQHSNIVTVTGGDLTPQEMDALKPVMLAALGFSLFALLFAILGTFKTRKVLTECQNERPFSALSVDALKASARFEVIAGIVGIVAACVVAFMAAPIKVNGASVGNSSASLNLSFLFYAWLKYLLYHVAEYGHRLESDPDKR